MLLADIPYFRKMIDEFPSFGQLTMVEQYQQAVETIIENPTFDSYFTLPDCERYEQKADIDEFIEKFKKLFKN